MVLVLEREEKDTCGFLIIVDLLFFWCSDEDGLQLTPNPKQ
jgi:hypothetical protein